VPCDGPIDLLDGSPRLQLVAMRKKSMMASGQKLPRHTSIGGASAASSRGSNKKDTTATAFRVHQVGFFVALSFALLSLSSNLFFNPIEVYPNADGSGSVTSGANTKRQAAVVATEAEEGAQANYHYHNHRQNHDRKNYALSVDKGSSKRPEIVWALSFPNSGTTYTLQNVQYLTNTSATTATNYGAELSEDYHRHDQPLQAPRRDMANTGPWLYRPDLPVSTDSVLAKSHCSGK